jgi:hypothetical protein
MPCQMPESAAVKSNVSYAHFEPRDRLRLITFLQLQHGDFGRAGASTLVQPCEYHFSAIFGLIFKKQTVSTGYYRIFSPIAGYKRCLRENVAISAEQSGVCRGIVGAFATSVYDRQSDCGTERRHDHRKHRAMPSVGRVTVWPFGARGRTDSALATSAHALVSDTLARPYDSVHESTPYHVTCISQRPSVSARQHWI